MYLTEFKKKLLAGFGIAITLATMGFYVFLMDDTQPVEATVVSTTVVTYVEPEIPSTTSVSCQGTSILFDINKTDSLISLDGYQDCFDWFASQYKLGKYTQINVIGRSSCDSSKENGIQISQDRADLIARSLVNAGIPAFAINSQGIGFSNPIGDCQTTKGAIANRSATIIGV